MSEAGEIDAGESQERDYEAEARQLGWHPLEEFRGNPSDWVDARTFVARGETQLPILRENNRKLAQRVRRADDEIAGLRATVDEVNSSVQTLRTMAEKSNEAGYQRALADLKAQQRQAVRDGDEATFDKIEGEIAKVEATREEVVTASAPKPVEQQPKGPKQTPEFAAWYADNSGWVNSDPILARYAVQSELELRQGDEPMSEGEIWDNVTNMVQQKYPRRYAAATGTEPVAPSAPSQGSAPRRAPGVLAPSGGAPSHQTRKGGIDAIADPTERTVARAAFNKIKRGIPDYTETEYMTVYVNPNADSIAPAIERRIKANGATH